MVIFNNVFSPYILEFYIIFKFTVPRQVLLAKLEQLQELDEPLDPSEDWLDYEEEGQAAPNTSGHHNSSTASNESITLHHNRGG